jgi:gas vesicle protein
MSSENKTSVSTVLLALLGGTILGAGAALLYAPDSGRRTRRKLADLEEDAVQHARELFKRAQEGAGKAGRGGERWMEQGREFVEEKKRELAELFHDGATKT